MRTFPIGGIHPADNKEWSKDKAIEQLELPNEVRIPVVQHIGAPANPIVAKGDKVLTGQLICEAVGFVSANIHSPISGIVTAVDSLPNGQGQRQNIRFMQQSFFTWHNNELFAWLAIAGYQLEGFASQQGAEIGIAKG